MRVHSYVGNMACYLAGCATAQVTGDAMSLLTNLEHKVLEACDNESMTCTPQERAEFKHRVSAFRNAASYADMWGFDVDVFRAAITKMTGVTKEDL